MNATVKLQVLSFIKIYFYCFTYGFLVPTAIEYSTLLYFISQPNCVCVTGLAYFLLNLLILCYYTFGSLPFHVLIWISLKFQMRKVIKLYNARFVVNVSDLGEDDPLLQNVRLF